MGARIIHSSIESVMQESLIIIMFPRLKQVSAKAVGLRLCGLATYREFLPSFVFLLPLSLSLFFLVSQRPCRSTDARDIP